MRKAKFNFSPAKQRKGFSFCIVYVSGKWEIATICFSLYISSNVKMAFVLIVSFFLGMQNRTWLHLISSQLREMLVMISMFFFMMSYL